MPCKSVYLRVEIWCHEAFLAPDSFMDGRKGGGAYRGISILSVGNTKQQLKMLMMYFYEILEN